jgi:PhnB protein
MSSKVKPIPEGYTAVTPYLIVADCAAAIEFYKKAFGATERFRFDAPGGKIGHAEIALNGSIIMLADEYPDMDAKSPRAYGGSPVSLMVYCEDVDALVKRAVDAGAEIVRPVENQFYGDRAGGLQDPFGHKWHIATHVEDVSPEEMKRRMEAFEKKSA